MVQCHRLGLSAGNQCPIPPRSVSRFNTVRDLLSKYCHSVTARERQEGFNPDGQKVLQLSQRELCCDFVALIKVALEMFGFAVLEGRSQVTQLHEQHIKHYDDAVLFFSSQGHGVCNQVYFDSHKYSLCMYSDQMTR